MKFDKIHNKGQARIFKNPVLEMLTITHPLVSWGMYVPVIAYGIYHSLTQQNIAWSIVILLFFGGIFFWSFFEYLIHRFAFHFVPKSKLANRFIFIIHGNHHQYPRDRQRLFMPPVPSLLIASTLFFIQYLVAYCFGVPGFSYAFFAGFLLGYLLYATMHYAIHAWKPIFPWMKPLWRNHHLHHYKEEQLGFGVSTTLWDRVFGTLFDLEKEQENAEEVKKLMF
jgi:sterol desaturase/sphingolipid hydroxylase (fatty acid hydroxylase superfamily)